MNMCWHDLRTINELAASFAKREGVEALVLAVAGPRIDFDDLLLLQFALRAQDKSRKIGAVLQVADDYPINLRSERPYRPALAG